MVAYFIIGLLAAHALGDDSIRQEVLGHWGSVLYSLVPLNILSPGSLSVMCKTYFGVCSERSGTEYIRWFDVEE